MNDAGPRDEGYAPMDEVHVKDMGKRLIAARQSQGLSQGDLAKLLNVSRAAYGHYESGLVAPSLRIVVQIASILKTTPEYIAFGVEGDRKIVKVAADPRLMLVPERNFDSLEAPVNGHSWHLPKGYVAQLGIGEGDAAVIVVVRSCVADLKPGDRLLVNASANKITVRGMYVIHDGFGMQIAQLSAKPGTSTVIVDYGEGDRHEVELGDFKVIGRVLAKVASV